VYHRRNRLSGSARFFIFGAHFFHLDFIVAQYARQRVLCAAMAADVPGNMLTAKANGFVPSIR
jgi:hypothetical protein